MKKIIFRADAKPSIGIGDLTSLINLSEYLHKDKWEIFFLIRNYKAGVDLAKKRGIQNLIIIDSDLSIENEIIYINNFIEDNQLDYIFFEITERKLSEYSNISKDIKKIAVNFDGDIFQDLDLVINWDIEAKNYYQIEDYPNTKFLLGSEYVILPKEFYTRSTKDRIFNNPPKQILIAMGGADEFDFTGKIIDIIIKNQLNIELNIIIGSGYEFRIQLEDRLSNSNFKYAIKQNIVNMLNEYLSCDIAIGAGGLTSSELVALHIPTILIATYKHQEARCRYFDKQGWVKYLGLRQLLEIDLLNALSNPIYPKNKNMFKTKVIIDEIEKI